MPFIEDCIDKRDGWSCLPKTISPLCLVLEYTILHGLVKMLL